MKKLLVSAIAVLLVAFSAVPAFAATVASPVATQPRVVSELQQLRIRVQFLQRQVPIHFRLL